MYFLDQLEEESKKRIRGFDFNTVRRTFSERIAGSNEGEMIKRFLEWGNHDISFGAFIGLAFVSWLLTI
jgi:hypothetical protein